MNERYFFFVIIMNYHPRLPPSETREKIDQLYRSRRIYISEMILKFQFLIIILIQIVHFKNIFPFFVNSFFYAGGRKDGFNHGGLQIPHNLLLAALVCFISAQRPHNTKTLRPVSCTRVLQYNTVSGAPQ